MSRAHQTKPPPRHPAAQYVAALLSLCIGICAHAQIEAEQLYCTIGRSIPCQVALPNDSHAVPEIALIDPATLEEIERAPAASGRVDLSTLFPVLWTTREPRVLVAQLFVQNEAVGPGLVLQPLLAPARSQDGLTREAIESFENNSNPSPGTLPDDRRRALRNEVRTTPASDPHYSGLRVYKDAHVRLRTTAGEMTFRLRPDKAPNTSFHFRSLVEGGFYNNTGVHRIIPAGDGADAFIVQAGDPIGTGFGGPGFAVDFEVSSLPHTFGVISMARIPTDPNSAGSQFFICLSRSACAGLDGLYTSFAELTESPETLAVLASVPVTHRDPENPASPRDRPLEPPVILEAILIDAPPANEAVTVIDTMPEIPIDR